MPRFIGNSAIFAMNQKPKLRKNVKVPIWLPPKRFEREYLAYLTRIVRDWERAAIEKVIPFLDILIFEAYGTLPPEGQDIKSDSIRLDDWVRKLDEIMQAYELSLSEMHPNFSADVSFLGGGVNKWNADQWFKITNRVMGVPLFQHEPWLEETISGFTKENVDLITNLRDSTVKDINGIINRGIKQGLRKETIRKQILEGTDLQKGRFRKTRTRAQLIARDQVDKLNGQLSKNRQTGVGMSRYIWRTSIDERVRPSHRAMEGRLCRWDDSTVYSDDGGVTWKPRAGIGGIEQHPGQDYQCRCWAEPDFTSLPEAEIFALSA